MKPVGVIEAEIKALNLVRSVVDDPAFEQALDFVTLALNWIIEDTLPDWLSASSPCRRIRSSGCEDPQQHERCASQR